ncbi:MAG: hypothetical protein IJH64_09765 [Oscillospiraceae bacterium]|nr:hypothetical protein [Oscillospiraceae bacterium]
MLVNIHLIVHHERYGKGEVIKVSDDRIYVAFGKQQRIFPYPQAFDKGYLTIGKAIKKEKAPNEILMTETNKELPASSRENTGIDFFERLRKDTLNKAVVIKEVKQGGYSIQDTENHRIARVQELKHKYKCTCDREQSRCIFDKIKDNYAHCEGFKYKVMNKGTGQEYRVLNLGLYDDLKSFVLTVISEYYLDN